MLDLLQKRIVVDTVVRAPLFSSAPLMGAVCDWCDSPFLTRAWSRHPVCPYCRGDFETSRSIPAVA